MTARVTVSPAGVVVATAHVVGDAPVLVVDDGTVSVRIDASALSQAACVSLARTLERATAQFAADLHEWGSRGVRGEPLSDE
ncbi:hypothetical protein F4561_005080 [Lipingzhangella halophila]|uniref:Uncharacterized protein n=1 Tax=Lipingzhangella halophila TaxID=1783352 RepID=A0A7W7W5X3_9ACTN|nr:hypothetical protein [Lipingzhangella halophila]MBB4934260.1 hypothetical protein [Lipingzhangella halophila]